MKPSDEIGRRSVPAPTESAGHVRLTAEDVVAYLTVATPEERWSILARVALAEGGMATRAPSTPPEEGSTSRSQSRDLRVATGHASVPPAEGSTSRHRDEGDPHGTASPRTVRGSLELVDPTRHDDEARDRTPGGAIDGGHAAGKALAPQAMATPAGTSPLPPAAAPRFPPPTTSATVPPSHAPAVDAVELLFEVMHDLTKLGAADEGARFCLEAAMRAVPCRAALAHLRDPATPELVVVHALGPEASLLFRARTPQSDPLIAQAARTGRPMVVGYGSDEARQAACPRHAYFDPRHVALVPIVRAGRLLGLLELLDPADGDPFQDASLDALAYLGERLGHFIVDHPTAPIPA